MNIAASVKSNQILMSCLGGSNFIASNSATDFFRKQGAKSSSNKSPWHPVSAATFFLTDSGSF